MEPALAQVQDVVAPWLLRFCCGFDVSTIEPHGATYTEHEDTNRPPLTLMLTQLSPGHFIAYK